VAAELVNLAYAATSGSGYVTKSSIEASDFPLLTTRTDFGFELLGFQLLKQDFTGIDPLSVTLDDPDWISLASVGPRNVPGWTSAPSYIATRWFYRVRTPDAALPKPSGSTTAGFWVATWAGVKDVLPVPQDLHTDSTITDVSASYTFTPTVTGLVVSHFLNTAGVPFGAAPCTTGTSLTIGGGGGLSHDWLSLTLEELRPAGWVVGSVGW
jgi:hypothetical protein